MIILDAYALIGLLAGERPTADLVSELLRRERAAVSTVNLIEVAYIVHRERGLAPARIRAQVDALGDRLVPLSLSEESAWLAAELRVRHYHRKNRPLSLAECALLASAGHGDSIATADPHVLAVAELEEIEVLPLPERSAA